MSGLTSLISLIRRQKQLKKKKRHCEEYENPYPPVKSPGAGDVSGKWD